jgi:molecular chaperone DnaK
MMMLTKAFHPLPKGLYRFSTKVKQGEYVIGIDLGTTNSCVSIMEAG